jgi:hypothetical protein
LKWHHIAVVTVVLGTPLCCRAQDPAKEAPAKSSASQEQTPEEKKASAAKDELSKKFSSDPAVVGVGVGSLHSAPVIYVYVTPDATKGTLDRIPKKCHGVPVSVVKSKPFKAL